MEEGQLFDALGMMQQLGVIGATDGHELRIAEGFARGHGSRSWPKSDREVRQLLPPRV
jgi:hypothetical protein